MQAHAKGRSIATGSGDFNAVLPNNHEMQAILEEYGLTTTAHETGVNTGTHHGRRIDYMMTADKDHRVTVHSMDVLTGPKFHSDHDPLHVVLSIIPQRHW
jgi:endonuclease/exonuclease/phosphatase family metal-dependent hydrolase